MKFPSRWRTTLLILLAGTVASWFLDPWVFEAFGIIEWHRPVRDWLVAHGWSRFARYYALVNMQISSLVVALLGGTVIGFVGHKRWLRFVCLYLVGSLVVPYFLRLTCAGPISVAFASPKIELMMAASDIVAVIPIALLAGWVASRPRKRRSEARRLAGLCPKCAYNLTGNVSGICPECGQPFDLRASRIQ